LEHYKPHEAVELVQQELEHRPDDSYLLLRLSLLGLRLNKSELICQDLNRLPSYTKIGPQNGARVVQLLVNSQQLEEAVKYSYRLLRHHPRNPEIRELFAMLMLGNDEAMPKVLKGEPASAGPSVAINYLEDGEGTPKWIVIEDESIGLGFDDEIPTNHPLVAKVIGKAVGETFLISEMSGQGRKAKILSLATKYVYRVRQTMDSWQIQFAGHPGFEKVHLAGMGNEDSLPDFTPIIQRTYDRKRHVDELLADYKNKRQPLHVLATSLGTSYFDVAAWLADHDDYSIRCCPGDRSAFEQAASWVRRATTLVIDSSSIATLDLLELDVYLERWPFDLTISTSTMTHLEDYERTLKASRGDGQVMTTGTGIGLRFVEKDDAAFALRLQRVERLIEYLRKHARIQDAGELVAVSKETRESLIKLLGLHGAETLALATRPGYILWSDDLVVGLLAQHFLPGSRRVWTQAVLAEVARLGLLTEDEYATAAAKLVGFRYAATHYNASVVTAACRIADWHPGAWPLKQALDALGEKGDTDAKWEIAVSFFRSLFLSDVLHLRHEEVALALLDRLAESSGGPMKVKELRQKLPMLFGFHLAAEHAAGELVTSWLRVRGEE
ncbi:MAG: hypothetical protein KDA84_03635, partial [Planctomycetaceae bacterium]|nr:hypothetical protein [Planctomycetaceae bacterium]